MMGMFTFSTKLWVFINALRVLIMRQVIIQAYLKSFIKKDFLYEVIYRTERDPLRISPLKGGGRTLSA